MNETFDRLLDKSIQRGMLPPTDIPDLDLYMDQIISLMSSHLSREGAAEPLTRTMIHNYSKAGLISPVKGKKYTKEHILQMLAIYSMKNTLSIAQIKQVLCGMHDDEAPDEKQNEKVLETCFTHYQNRRDEVQSDVRGLIENIVTQSGVDFESRGELFGFLLMLTDVTDTLSAFASAIAEQCFPEPPSPKKKKNKPEP